MSTGTVKCNRREVIPTRRGMDGSFQRCVAVTVLDVHQGPSDADRLVLLHPRLIGVAVRSSLSEDLLDLEIQPMEQCNQDIFLITCSIVSSLFKN